MIITFVGVWELINMQKTWWGSMSSAVPKRCRINCPKEEGRGWLPDAGGWRACAELCSKNRSVINSVLTNGTTVSPV